MKTKYMFLFMLLCLSVKLAPVEIQDINDVEGKEEDPNNIPGGYARPDINCLLNKWGNFFAETQREFNGQIDPEPFNMQLDPFIIDLNNRIEQKSEGIDDFLTVQDINEFFEIDGEEFIDLKEFFNECSQLPHKVGLEIDTLNYYYCVIVWKNGFDIYSEKLIHNKEYKKGFFRIIDDTVGQIFNYKTYIRSLKLTKYMNTYWSAFYSNFNEFLNLNTQYMNYNREIIIGIKQNNYFFKKEEMQDKNVFFKFYLNNLEILRALNKAYFNFSISSDKIMTSIQNLSEKFRAIIVDELYGSIFYLFMRNDETFIENFEKFAVKSKFVIPATEEQFETLEKKIQTFMDEEIEKANYFDAEKLNPPKKPRKITGIPTDHPLLNSSLDKYKTRSNFESDLGKAEEAERSGLGDELGNQLATDGSSSKLPFTKAKSVKELILENNQKAKELREQSYQQRQFIKNFKVLGPNEPKNQERVLAETTKTAIVKKPKKTSKTSQNLQKKIKLEKKRALMNFEMNDEKLRKTDFLRTLFDVPAQPEINEPAKFFSRMDELKKPLPIKKRRLTVTQFFKMYEDRVAKYYGTSINLELVRLCKKHFSSRIVHFPNIFCMVFQRESNLLIQQKYANSKVKAFIDKYLPFITYNFFTYFRILEEKEDLVDIAVLTLFYNEKFFSAIKLSIVSLNNLIMHFEDDYKNYFMEKLEFIMMPYLNKFKNTLMKTFYDYGDELDSHRVKKFEYTDDEMKVMFLPSFRVQLDELVIKPSCDQQNLMALRNQYSDYVNSMNLLSFDKIKENFVAHSKKSGLVISSEGPKKECEELFIQDIVEAHKREMMEKQGKGQMNDEEEYQCIKNWKLYDDVFHNVFFNTETKEIIVKAKTASSVTEKNQFDHMMENELKRVVNYFVPSRMKDVLEHLVGANQFGLSQCGLINNYSRTACFAIFGNNNCREVTGTIYYTRKCPKGYKPDGISCSFDCAKIDMEEDIEFCRKENPNLPCPKGLITKDDTSCLKPPRRYFMYIMNPFNNKQ